MLFAIHFILDRKHRKRDAAVGNNGSEGYFIEKVTEDGQRVEIKVDKEYMDLTDRQNRDFKYAS
ncbi:hypothetical protein PAXRUDRAFT_829831, partial [Paxillus rubicundulus Ve08.2h10]